MKCDCSIKTAINEVYVFYSDILLKNTNSFILLIKLFGLSITRLLIGLNPHATELSPLMPVPANKMELFST